MVTLSCFLSSDLRTATRQSLRGKLSELRDVDCYRVFVKTLANDNIASVLWSHSLVSSSSFSQPTFLPGSASSIAVSSEAQRSSECIAPPTIVSPPSFSMASATATTMSTPVNLWNQLALVSRDAWFVSQRIIDVLSVCPVATLRRDCFYALRVYFATFDVSSLTCC